MKRQAFQCPLPAVLAAVLMLALPARTDEPKNHDHDVVREESRVAPFHLPPLMVTAEGTPVTTAGQWLNQRRPQVMGLFANLLYGSVPEPSSPIQVTREVLRIDRSFMDGKATRKDVRIRFENARGSAEMVVLVFVPNSRGNPAKPSPMFLLHSFSNTRDNGHDADPGKPGLLRNGIPLGLLLDRGFGFVAVHQGDLVRHNEVEFLKGIHPLFYRDGQSFPKALEF